LGRSAFATVLEVDEVQSIAQREGWPAKTCNQVAAHFTLSKLDWRMPDDRGAYGRDAAGISGKHLSRKVGSNVGSKPVNLGVKTIEAGGPEATSRLVSW